MEMEYEESEPICSNCTYFFPASMDEPTEYGICFYDKAFEPYIDELIEEYNYSSCQELIEEKKIHGDTKACEHFEEPEEIEPDDNRYLRIEFKKQEGTGKLDIDAMETALLLDRIEKIDWKTHPVDKHVVQLNSPYKHKQLQGVSSLAGLAKLGNEKALDELIEYFGKLPSPNTLEEVHFKMEIFGHFEYMSNKPALVPHLIDELYHIQSNNTTRQWISKILKYLEHCPIDEVREPLEKLLEEKKFSHKLKDRIRRTIFACEEHHSWN